MDTLAALGFTDAEINEDSEGCPGLCSPMKMTTSSAFSMASEACVT